MSDPVAPGQGTQPPEAPRYAPAPEHTQPVAQSQPLPEALDQDPGQAPTQGQTQTPAQTPAQTLPQGPDPAQAPTQGPTPAQAPTPAPVQAQAAPRPRPARAIAIAAMAVGLAAIVTTLVAAFYAPVALILSAGLAIAAIVLGGISLARRAPLAPGLTGLVTGALAIVVTLCVGLLGLGSLGVQALMGATTNTSQGETEQDGDPSAPTPGTPNNTGDVSWPANFASGGMMFTAGPDAQLRVIESDPLPDNSFPNLAELPVAADGSKTDRIQMYVDYRCPACLMFEMTNGDTLEDAARAGAVVELQPLTFLDQVSQGSYYSSRAAGAMACIVEQQPEIAWTAHRSILNPDFQPAEGIAGPNNAEIVERIEAMAGSLNREARSCIAKEQHVTFAQALSSWISANPVPRAQDPELRVTGTPLVVVNGVAFTGSISDADAFTKFLAQQGVALQ